MKNASNIKLTLGEPYVIARGPADERRWGYYQFPAIERFPDGRLHVSYSKQEDSPTSYGEPRVHLVSNDNGNTWEEAADPDNMGRAISINPARWPCLTLPNGDMLRVLLTRSRKVEDLNLPKPFGIWGEHIFKTGKPVYRVGDLPEELRDGRHIARLNADNGEWKEEVPGIQMDGEVRWAGSGVFTFPTFRGMRLAPDGSIWAKDHSCMHLVDGKIPRHTSVLLFRSTDNGHSFNLHGEIRYRSSDKLDPQWNNRLGFTEPDIGFAPDGSIICFMRTEGGLDRLESAPMYWARSSDNGKTWSEPAIFDKFGVSPEICRLDCGVMLLSYGRPGLYIRAAADSAYAEWSDKTTVVEPGGFKIDKWNTCAYPFMVALDENSAMICYSHFNYPDEKGIKRKTILVRKVTVS